VFSSFPVIVFSDKERAKRINGAGLVRKNAGFGKLPRAGQARQEIHFPGQNSAHITKMLYLCSAVKESNQYEMV
jgi:hypothetical protein